MIKQSDDGEGRQEFSDSEPGAGESRRDRMLKITPEWQSERLARLRLFGCCRYQLKVTALAVSRVVPREKPLVPSSRDRGFIVEGTDEG